ncbi:tyrosine-type recombinase/integrase [Mycolicibacter longobardus]|uniref:Transposase n=1 Tax=Mycolicibacter longobardus TaxID=1108812 RepID=A0A1X1YAH9_9MYCO|nr:tyrosine-type recombinase/integrase [Mycolicibacter longobardus]ORW08117.1 transposase [Mycolicibacter longobardus]
MTTPTEPPGNPATTLALVGSWDQQWAAVPELWRDPVYRVGAEPFKEVFVRSRSYCKPRHSDVATDFTPDAPARFAREIAWWVWWCWNRQTRKIDPSLLAWLVATLPAAITDHTTATGQPPTGIADMDPNAIVRQAILVFQRRNHRLPSAGSRRNFTQMIEHLHLRVAVHCTDVPWWAHDVWDLRADPRIPQRPHEPAHDKIVRLRDIEPVWLREGLRFWLRSALTYEMLAWSSVADRCRNVGTQLGRFVRTHGHQDDPLIATDPDELRAVFVGYLDYLRSPAAATRCDHLSVSGIAYLQAQTQAFYTFMYDNAADAAAATGNPRWRDITATHTALWSPLNVSKYRSGQRALTWYSTGDLQSMLDYLDVLAAGPKQKVVLTHPDGTITVATGLGDPQAARTWLLQALTGRRASEILMLDYDPIEAIPGQDRPAGATADEGAFVARLRYQQTKVDGVVPTILVEQAVVDVIREQQRWLNETYPQLDSKYLFVGVRNQHQGRRPRSYTTYRVVLSKLDAMHNLIDSAGNPLQFTQTHRLRHTRATELLNDGVPFHVVQRYLGHKSPEMTARYAATLAATAEAEFLKHKKIGAHGADIGISPHDIYEMTQLAQRTGRVLPNGVCLLPPLKSCDKGNACLSCGHFATDATHLSELRQQLAATESLINQRQNQYRQRSGRELGEDNVWIIERRREIASLQAIIYRLTATADAASVAGAGTGKRLPLLPIQTRGAHQSALDKATDPQRAEQ